MAKLQNIINSPTFSSGWVSFSTTIGSTGTAPTLGSGAAFTSYCLQQGKNLLVSMTFSQTSAGTAGSGIYLFSIPSGYTINTTITGTYTSSAPYNLPSIGTITTGIGNSSGNLGSGSAVVYNTTQYLMFSIQSGNANFLVGSNYYSLGNATVCYSANLMIPVN